MTFGELVHWLDNLESNAIKERVSTTLGFPNIALMKNALSMITTVRNICAHHGRLWDKPVAKWLSISPHYAVPLQTFGKKPPVTINPQIYNCLLALGYIVLSIDPHSTWVCRLTHLVKASTTPRQQTIMGFPVHWDIEPFWFTNQADFLREQKNKGKNL